MSCHASVALVLLGLMGPWTVRAAIADSSSPITDKTLVAWVCLANTAQRGGSVLTIEDGSDHFDALVFGETAPGKWMAGSDLYARSQRDQSRNPAETADTKTVLQIAAVYQGDHVTLYRNGSRYAAYRIARPCTFGPESVAIVGLRHRAAKDRDGLAADVEDARIYGIALSPEQLAALKSKTASEPKPLAWWTFDGKKAEDRMGRFPHTKLCGEAKMVGGKLHLDGRGSYLIAARDEAAASRGPSSVAGLHGGNSIDGIRELRRQLVEDRYRPTYHIVAPEGLCSPFDPNGALFWKGRYHLMYIVQTGKGHCWAHISSTDLVHWRHHPLALEPGDGDNGIFSGGAALDKHGVPTITYWGLGKPGGVCIATSTDKNLDHWTKSPHNPLIRETQAGVTQAVGPGGRQTVGAADPSAIWIKDGHYYLLTGNLLVLRSAGRNATGDTLYLFTSDDLVHWKYLHPFYESDRKWTRGDEDDMCPDFFPLPSSPKGGPPSDRHMILFISHNHGCQYYVGRYENDRFRPETHERMTWSDNSFFAPESLVDAMGRRIMWAWIMDQRSSQTRQASAWSGELSLPRVLWLGKDKTLRMAPAEELATLRYEPQSVGSLTVAADAELPLPAVSGNAFEMEIEMLPDQARQFGVKVCCSPGGEEQTLVFYDADEKKLKIDTTRSSLGEGPKKVEGGPLTLEPGEPLKLRVFVDKSVIEVFANDRQAVMRRIYPSRGDALGVVLFSRGGTVKVPSLRAWQMSPANPY